MEYTEAAVKNILYKAKNKTEGVNELVKYLNRLTKKKEVQTRIEKKVFERLKDILRRDGWTEQKAGEVYFNGRFCSNFQKGTQIIHLAWDTNANVDALRRMRGL